MLYLDELIKKSLEGDENRVAEFFNDNIVFDELVARGKDSDWYHFESKTYDGQYFVKIGDGYVCYQQDRGVKSQYKNFSNIQQAAVYFFTLAGYIKPTKKWWQF